LRLHQRLQAPLRRGKEALGYEHLFVDESQDLSPLELAVVLDTARSESVTLAGDVAQRLMLDNGFSNWKSVLQILGRSHVEIEPLRITYRSTQEIMDFANEVLGPLRNEESGQATRHGTPVELFRFAHTGDAVGFLAESLRALLALEPLASVAVIARAPEQVREYADGLTRAEVPHVRLISEQDFPFKPGVDVTDVRQVKGLEFDYVVLVDVTAQNYPRDDESRHLLHIAASRAAHQLWIMTTEAPSPLLPRALCERGY
jgi:DNA helicase-2/ATP-dependent DNA helicase PcrA